MRAKQPLHFLVTLLGSALLLCSCNKNDTTAMTSGYKPMDGGTLGQTNLDKHSPPSGCFFCCSSSALDAVVDTNTVPSRLALANNHIEKISTKDTSTTVEDSLTPTTVTEADFPIQEAPNAASTASHHQREVRSKQAVAEREAAIQIQAVVRGHSAKSQLAVLKEEKMRSNQAAERKAAIQIQAAVRGHNAKSQLAVLREKEMRSKQVAKQKAAIQIQGFARRINADRRLAMLEEQAEVEGFSTPPRKNNPLSTAAGVQTTPPIIGKYKVVQSQDERSAGAQSVPVGRYRAIRSRDEQSTSAQSAPISRYKTVQIQDQDERSVSAQSAPMGKYRTMQNQDERSVSARSAPISRYKTVQMQNQDERSIGAHSAPVKGGCAARQRVLNGAEENVLDTSYDSSIASTESFGFSKKATMIEFSGIKKVNKRNAGAIDSAEYHARRHHANEHGRTGVRAGSAKSTSPVIDRRATAGQDKQAMSTRSAPTGGHAARQNQVAGHAQGENGIRARYIELRVQAKSQITGVLQDSTNAALLSTSLGLSSDSEDDSSSSFISAEVQSTEEDSATESITERRLGVQEEIPESTARTIDGGEEGNSSDSESTDDDGEIMEEEYKYKLLRN